MNPEHDAIAANIPTQDGCTIPIGEPESDDAGHPDMLQAFAGLKRASDALCDSVRGYAALFTMLSVSTEYVFEVSTIVDLFEIMANHAWEQIDKYEMACEGQPAKP